jgi:hypothetical protein
MKKTVLFALVAFAVLFLGLNVDAAAPTKVEVLYMNHGPLQETLGKMKTLFSGFGDKLSVSWHDFDSKDGEQFMASKGIKQHTPLVIWIDGKQKCTVNAKEITFAGFPTGSGPAFFQGKWTLDDLKAALDQAVGKK